MSEMGIDVSSVSLVPGERYLTRVGMKRSWYLAYDGRKVRLTSHQLLRQPGYVRARTFDKFDRVFPDFGVKGREWVEMVRTLHNKL